ncbi:two-component system regulatory protein YycI [Ornithinibacillus scapharcae]|uniref:two-component system regulatory protein YycI n=1 Tax=Ornithinibacillus scapharcae TaxID=1147159 RepID=UPI000225B80F|nr:two-component system regulatory protein YycI [Ornithinibacillus scapharcae]
MQWGQIKTLFILCFLLLDIYLLFLVLQNQGTEDLGLVQREEEKQDHEQSLKSENISIPDDLPEKLPDEANISIRQKTFDKKEITSIKSMANQDVEVVNDSFIISKIKEEIPIPENATNDGIAQLVSNTVYLGKDFRFHYWDEQRNILVFSQLKNNRPVYYNQNGILLVFLNDENEIIGYIQSFLGEPEKVQEEEKRPLILPITAIHRLYEANIVLPYDEVDEAEIVYHSRFPLDSGLQVLVPAWKISVNGKREHLVNAIETIIISVSEDFIDNVIELSIENTRSIKGREDFKEDMLEILTSKLNTNRSEST